jgi:hypothetical protein
MKTVIDLYADLPYLTKYVTNSLPLHEMAYLDKKVAEDVGLQEIVECIRMDMENQHPDGSFADFAEKTTEQVWDKISEKYKGVDIPKQTFTSFALVGMTIMLLANIMPHHPKLNQVPQKTNVPAPAQPLPDSLYAANWTLAPSSRPPAAQASKSALSAATAQVPDTDNGIFSRTPPKEQKVDNTRVVVSGLPKKSRTVYKAPVTHFPGKVISEDPHINELYCSLDSLLIKYSKSLRAEDSLLKEIRLAIDFAKSNEGYAVYASHETGLSARDMLERAMQESYFGTGYTSIRCNNFFNLKKDLDAHALADDRSSYEVVYFRTYATPQESYSDYARVLRRLIDESNKSFHELAGILSVNKARPQVLAMIH